MMTSETLRIPVHELRDRFFQLLLDHGFPETKARICAATFANNSLEGVYTHGVNRFAKFISYVRKKLIDPNADATCISRAGFLEQWDGHSGIGITNAFQCIERAMEMAESSGIACVALANTNHWMRAGTYGRHAAAKGFAAICWSNTIQNTPAWGAVDPRLGNNPVTIAVPYGTEHIVLDMAMSQFSYGALDKYRMSGSELPVPGGYDDKGNLTVDPREILKTRRTLPIGYWKGSGLSLLLDVLATVLSGGLSVSQISKQKEETRVSQVFIAISLRHLQHYENIPHLIEKILEDFHQSVPEKNSSGIRYPGERVGKIRSENLEKGIPVLKTVWDEITALPLQ